MQISEIIYIFLRIIWNTQIYIYCVSKLHYIIMLQEMVYILNACTKFLSIYITPLLYLQAGVGECLDRFICVEHSYRDTGTLEVIHLHPLFLSTTLGCKHQLHLQTDNSACLCSFCWKIPLIMF